DVVDSAEAQQLRAQLMLNDKRKTREAIERSLAERAQRPEVKEQLAKDSAIIADYLKKKKITAQSLPSGLRYVVKTEGEGETPDIGHVAYVKYSGYLLDGKQFDSG